MGKWPIKISSGWLPPLPGTLALLPGEVIIHLCGRAHHLALTARPPGGWLEILRHPDHPGVPLTASPHPLMERLDTQGWEMICAACRELGMVEALLGAGASTRGAVAVPSNGMNNHHFSEIGHPTWGNFFKVFARPSAELLAALLAVERLS